jgi:succinyl-CoA synthetase beta subunit
MNIHEYQAKALLRAAGAPVSDGRLVTRAEDAKTAAGQIDGPVWVVKAQIHAGGRGKGTFKEPDAGDKGASASPAPSRRPSRRPAGCWAAPRDQADRRAGKQVDRVYIEDGADIARELYLALLVDRAPPACLRGLAGGGMDIEEVAHSTPRRS